MEATRNRIETSSTNDIVILVQDSFTFKLITILAGALAGLAASFWNTRLQEFLKRRGLHKRLHLHIADHHQQSVKVRIQNSHVLPLTSCWAYISVDYLSVDILQPPSGFSAHINPDEPYPLHEDRLCWSVQYPEVCPPVVDIYAGEYQSLEVFRFGKDRKWIGVYSETHDKPYRVFLRGDRVYSGHIRIVARETHAKVFKIIIDLKNDKSPLSIRSE